MIISRISGGLGNQMFQYARGRALALRNKTDLVLDISSYGSDFHHDAPRDFTLNRFNIMAEIASKDHFNKLGVPNIQSNSLLGKIARGVFRAIESSGLIKRKRLITESSYDFQPELFDPGDNVYLSGVWQSEKYFSDFSRTIREDLTLKDNISGELTDLRKSIEQTESVSIHIRRGDYVNVNVTNKKHGTCSLDYYMRAIQYMEQHANNPKFFVFSDDIDWVRDNLDIPQELIYVSNDKIKDHEELSLMSECKHHIIANSSFSWWGAWLGDYKAKMVVAPDKWLISRDNTPDIIPDTWVRIEDAY